MDFDGKVSVITGGARGIGRAIAEILSQRGADLVIADLQLELAEKTAQEIAQATGRRAMAVRVDVSSLASANEMSEKVIAEFGRLDILVNNAGITRDKLIMRMEEQDWDLVIDINLKGAFNCCKAVIRKMIKQR